MGEVLTKFVNDKEDWEVGDIVVVTLDRVCVGMITITNGVYALTDLGNGGTLRLYSENKLFQSSELIDLKNDILCSFEDVKHYQGDKVKITLEDL